VLTIDAEFIFAGFFCPSRNADFRIGAHIRKKNMRVFRTAGNISRPPAREKNPRMRVRIAGIFVVVSTYAEIRSPQRISAPG
jgi:hypothetical protein